MYYSPTLVCGRSSCFPSSQSAQLCSCLSPSSSYRGSPTNHHSHPRLFRLLGFCLRHFPHDICSQAANEFQEEAQHQCHARAWCDVSTASPQLCMSQLLIPFCANAFHLPEIRGGVAAIYKCVQLPVLAYPHNDVTWTTAPLLYCIAIEANVVIIAASTPTIGPLIRVIRSSLTRKDADGNPRTPQSFSSFGTPPFLRRAFSNAPAMRYKQFSADSSAEDNQRLKKEQAAFATSSLESGTTGQFGSSAKQSPSIYRTDNTAARTRDLEARAGLAPPPVAYAPPQHPGSQNLPPTASREGAEMEMKILGHDIPRSHSDNSDGERYGHHEGHLGGGRVIMH